MRLVVWLVPSRYEERLLLACFGEVDGTSVGQRLLDISIVMPIRATTPSMTVPR